MRLSNRSPEVQKDEGTIKFDAASRRASVNPIPSGGTGIFTYIYHKD